MAETRSNMKHDRLTTAVKPKRTCILKGIYKFMIIKIIPWFILLALQTYSITAFAEIYKWTDENGRVHYDDKPPTDTQVDTLVYSNEVMAIDYANPESVARAFLAAVKDEDYKRIPSMVAPSYQHRYTPEAIKKELETITIPDNLELKVRDRRVGQIHLVVVEVVGTEISLELRQIAGKWLLEP